MQLFGTSGIRRVINSGLIQMALKVGLTVEAKSETQVHQLYDGGIRTIKDCMKSGGEK